MFAGREGGEASLTLAPSSGSPFSSLSVRFSLPGLVADTLVPSALFVSNPVADELTVHVCRENVTVQSAAVRGVFPFCVHEKLMPLFKGAAGGISGLFVAAVPAMQVRRPPCDESGV